MKNHIPKNFQDLNDIIIGFINKEISLYGKLVKAASVEKTAISSEDLEGLAEIASNKQRHIAEIDELESQLAPLRRKWMALSGRNTAAVGQVLNHLGSLARELSSRQHENQELLKKLLSRTRKQIRELKSGGQALNSYGTQRNDIPRFLDIKR